MFRLTRPTALQLRAFLDRERQREFTYPAIGPNGTAPRGYVTDRHRVLLGNGDAVFDAAVGALKRWQQFELGWLEAWPRETPIQPGEVVAVVAHVFGLWCVNACRIVYTIDELQPARRFGFAYGTLPGHVESGEERFLIEMDHATGQVWYDILAFSRPRHLLARLGYPIVRKLQKRFALNSMAAMKASV
jgi:uncharacterized protein (UPF0548 family)